MPGAGAALKSGHLWPTASAIFGASTVLLNAGDEALLVDGFFTRPRRIVTSRIESDPAVVRGVMKQAGIERMRLRSVLVTHAHYDHVLDAPAVAQVTGADFVGSESSANVARGARRPPDRIIESGHCSTHSYPPFRVTMIESRHGRPFVFRGSVERPLSAPAHVSAWREGGSYAFHFAHPDLNVLVHPGTNYVPGVYRGFEADVVFLSIAFLAMRSGDFAERYWCEVVRRTGARLVVPIHWDSFTEPLGKKLSPLISGEFKRSRSIVERLGQRDGVVVRFMQPFQPLDLLSELPPGRTESEPFAPECPERSMYVR